MYDKEMLNTPEKALVVMNELIALNKQLSGRVDYYKYDDLTTLMLRKDHCSILRSKLNELNLHNIPFTYAILDVNGLKDVNTNEGYVQGDVYIKSVSDELIKRFKEAYLFRIGGDEFAIIKKGNCCAKFEKKLSKIKNIEYGIVCVDQDCGLNSINSLVTHVDNIVISKKARNKKRFDD